MQHVANPANDKQPAPASQKAVSEASGLIHAGSLILAVITAVILLGAMTVHLFFVPRFIEIYQDSDTQLPWLTVKLLVAPTAVVVLVYFVAAACLILKEFIPRLDNRIKLAVSVLALVISLVLVPLYLIGLFLPVIQLQESLM